MLCLGTGHMTTSQQERSWANYRHLNFKKNSVKSCVVGCIHAQCISSRTNRINISKTLKQMFRPLYSGPHQWIYKQCGQHKSKYSNGKGVGWRRQKELYSEQSWTRSCKYVAAPVSFLDIFSLGEDRCWCSHMRNSVIIWCNIGAINTCMQLIIPNRCNPEMYWKHADWEIFCRISLYALYVLTIPTHSSVLYGFTMLVIPNLCDKSYSSFRRSRECCWCIECRISGGVSHLAVKNTNYAHCRENSNAERHCAMCEDSKNTTLCSLSSTLCPPIAFKDLPRRSRTNTVQSMTTHRPYFTSVPAALFSSLEVTDLELIGLCVTGWLIPGPRKRVRQRCLL